MATRSRPAGSATIKRSSSSARPPRSAKTSASTKTSKEKAAAAPHKTYHHGDLRRALLDAAVLELNEVGPDELSLRGVARRAGVSHAAPYHHFADKSVLLAHLAAVGFTRFREHLVSAAAEGGDAPRLRLARMGLGYLRFARAEHALFALMGSSPSQTHAEVWAAAADASFAVLVDEVARVRADAGRTGRPEPDAYLHWSVVHGLAHLEQGFGLGHRVDVDALYMHIAARVDAIYDEGAREPPSSLSMKLTTDC